MAQNDTVRTNGKNFAIQGCIVCSAVSLRITSAAWCQRVSGSLSESISMPKAMDEMMSSAVRLRSPCRPHRRPENPHRNVAKGARIGCVSERNLGR